jgi:hypothetical protein
LVFLEVRYDIYDRNSQPIGKRRAIINMDCIRRVSKSENGWARLHWTTRVDPITLDETYDSFCDRIKDKSYVIIALPDD